jgi:hypothetical protein
MTLATYGVDVWCTDAKQLGRLAKGPLVVLQACYRRQVTPPGVLRKVTADGIVQPKYGIDLPGYIGEVDVDLAIASLPGVIRAELLSDDRVRDVEVDVTRVDNPDGTVELVLDERIYLHDEDAGFALSLRVSDVSVSLISLGGASS